MTFVWEGPEELRHSHPPGPSPGMIPPGILSSNIADPKPGKGRACALWPSPTELGEKNEC